MKSLHKTHLTILFLVVECRLHTSSSRNKYNLFLLSLKCFEENKAKKKKNAFHQDLQKGPISPSSRSPQESQGGEVKPEAHLFQVPASLSPSDTPFLREGCSPTHRCSLEVPYALRPTDMAVPRCTSPKSSRDFKKVLQSSRSQTAQHKGIRSPGYTAMSAEKDLFGMEPLLQLVTLDCHYTGLQNTSGQVLSMENHGFLDKHCLGI